MKISLAAFALTSIFAIFSACSSSSSSSGTSPYAESSDWRDSCVAIINAYRTEEGAAQIERNVPQESCTDKQAAKDLAQNSAHGHFGSCGEFAQNSGPNISTAYYPSEEAIVRTYLGMMWSEKELAEAGDSVYSHIGHYLNMKNSQVESVACGIAYSGDGKTAWLNVNFF